MPRRLVNDPAIDREIVNGGPAFRNMRRTIDENFRDLFGFQAGGVYDTFALAKAADVPADVNFIHIRSHTLGVPGSDANYRRLDSDPGYAEPFAFRSDDGAWWQLDELLPNPKMFGAKGDDVTDDKLAVQKAIDQCAAAGIWGLWFDVEYIIGGSKHSNGLAILDWKQVSLVGPGGLKLADNTNVANSVFTATFAGTQMTVTAMTSGSIIANQFLAGTGLSVAVQVSTQVSGTPNGAGVYTLTASQSITGPITVSGVNRLTEMLGNYDMVTGLSDIECSISFDYNGANNCASGTIWSWNTLVTINKGSNVTFRGAKFRNNCGSNVLVLGTLTGTPTISNVTIDDCLFENEGNRVNAVARDYSTIFCIADGLSITGSTFRLGAFTNGCPWEVYGKNIVISGNKVQGYFNTANICAVENMLTENVVVSGNTVDDCSVGFTLWATAATARLWGVNISGNVLSYNVSAAGGPYFVNAVDQVHDSANLRNIVVHGNVGQNFDLSDTSRTAYAVAIKAAYSASVADNTFWGFPGQGVLFTNCFVGGTFEAARNKIMNCGYTSALSSLRVGVQMDPCVGGNAANVLVEGNTINPISGYTMTAGIVGTMNADSGYVGGRDLVVGCTTKIDWTGTGVGGIYYTLPKESGFADTAGRQPSTYMRTKDGLVHVDGVITLGTIAGTTLIATLPAGYRPTDFVYPTIYNLTTDVAQALIVGGDGTITNRAGLTTGDVVGFAFAFKVEP